jgi:ATP phosphoribosyltransferase
VTTVHDLAAIAMPFRRAHGRWPRAATKYMNLTRRFFTSNGFGDYRIVESLGATEGTPAAGTAEFIVDITTTGETLRANGLRILDDGIILKSEANLVASNLAAWTPELAGARDKLLAHLASAAGLVKDA